MKLEIEKIQWKNFFSYGKVMQEILLQPGLNLILGNDITKDRSNAVGKSGFLETIPFALFGKVNRNVRKESIINWKNRKNCEVYLTFKKGGIEYVIHRALKPDKLEVYQDGKQLPTPSHKIDYQRQIEEDILGIDFKTFMSLVYSNLNSSQPILSMTAGNKRKFIETVFGLELFTQLHNKCNEKLKSVAEKTFTYKTKKEYLEKSMEDLQKQIIEGRSQLYNITSFEAELSVAKDEYNKTKVGSPAKKLESLKEKLSKKQSELQSLRKKLYESDSKVMHIKGQIEILDGELEKIGDVEKDTETFDRIKKEYNSAYQSPLITSQIDSLNDELMDLSIKLDKLRTDLDIINHDIIENNVTIKSSSSSLELLMGVSICPTCGTLIDSNRIAKDKDKNVKEVKKKLAILDKKKKTLENLMKSGKDRRIEIQESIKNLTELKIKQIELGAQLTSFSHLDEKIKNKKLLCKEKKEKEKELLIHKKEYNSIEKKMEILNDEIGEFDKERAELEERLARVSTLKNKMMLLEEKVRSETEAKTRLENLIKGYEDKLYEISNEKRGMSIQISRMSGINDYLDFVKLLCRDEQVKQYAISTIIPFLNKQTNRYLSEVGHSFYVVLDNWLDEEIRGPGIVNCSYGNLSGGEAKSVDFALQMALLDIARIQAGVFPDLLQLDEILDSSVDSYGLEKIFQILKNKQMEDKGKVFIVSHRREVNDIDIDHCYIVEKKDGFSYIRLQ